MIPNTSLDTVGTLLNALRHNLEHSSILVNLLRCVSTSLVVSLSLGIEILVSLRNNCACPLTGLLTFYYALGNLSILIQSITQFGRINDSSLEGLISVQQLLVDSHCDILVCNSLVLFQGVNQVGTNLAKNNKL